MILVTHKLNLPKPPSSPNWEEYEHQLDRITLVTRVPVNLNMPKYGAISRTVILIAY